MRRLVFWILVAVVAPVAMTSQDPAGELVVTGQVTDELGRPVRGAAVGAMRWGDEDTEALLARPQTTTADDGTYRLVLAVPQYVTAIAPDRQVCSVHGWWAVSGVVDLRLLPGAVLGGRVTDASGVALAAARVTAYEAVPQLGVARRLSMASTRTDASGRFRLHGVATTGLRVKVSHPGCYSHAAVAHAGEPFEAKLERSGFVRGRVVGASGEPVPGVAVQIEYGEHGNPVSDAEGRFAIGVPRRGSFHVYGHGPKPRAYFRSRALTGPADDVAVIAWGSPEAADAVEPAAAPTNTNDAGVPAAGWIDVTWTGACPDGGPATVVAHAMSYAAGSNPAPFRPLATTLGPEPRLRLGPVALGEYSISLVRDSRARLDAGCRFELGVVGGHGLDSGELSLAATAMVLQRGKVELVASAPRARIGVIAHWRPVGMQRSTPPRHDAQVAGLDRDGGFALDLPPGRWLLQLFDVATGVVFHTEASPHDVAPGGPPLVLQPALHVLEYELVAAAAGDEPMCDWLEISLHHSLHHASARGWAVVQPLRNPDLSPSGCGPRGTLRPPGRRGLCLVPSGPLSLGAYRQLESDEPAGCSVSCVGGESVDVKDAVHRVRIEIGKDR